MGVFDIYSYTRKGNQKITPVFLKQLGFEKNEWGNPNHWLDGHHTFWEYYIEDYEVTIWYFTEEFTGYVTDFSSKGKNPAGAICCFTDSSITSFIDISDKTIQYPKTKMDIISYLDMIEEKVKQLNK